MAADLGNLFLYLALLVSLLLGIKPLGKYIGCQLRASTVQVLWLLELILVVAAFCCLVYVYIVSDFSVLNVVYNSSVAQPLIYKIAASWGNHEGSMLLWVLVFSLFSCIFSFLQLDKELVCATQVIQGIFNCFFLSFIIFSSNPFVRIFPVLQSGFGLNPLLQDVGITMHPPLLYLGYIGFSVAYCATIAGLLLKRIGKEWAALVRLWVSISWAFLTLGIALGSWWAYRELGWGGFWFWDPVENSSLIPWLLATALIHVIVLYQKTGRAEDACILLAILSFTFSMVGTFLVRSGLVTSIHSFALDPERGTLILGFIAVSTILSLSLYAFRAGSEMQAAGIPHPLSRSTFIFLNTLFLSVAAFTVILGTLYPLALEVLVGEQISVGAPYFNTIFGPLAVAVVILCSLSAYSTFTGSSVYQLFKKQYFGLAAAAIATIFLSLFLGLDTVLVILGVFGGIYLMVTMVKLFIGKYIYGNARVSSHFYIMVFGHLGLGIIVLATSLNSALQSEKLSWLKAKESFTFRELKITLNALKYYHEANYFSRVASFSVHDKGGRFIAELAPETRIFPVEKQQTTEAAILHNLFYDLYITIGEFREDLQTLAVQVYYRPMIGWLWFGSFIVFLAGFYSVVLQLQKYYNARHYQ